MRTFTLAQIVNRQNFIVEHSPTLKQASVPSVLAVVTSLGIP